MIRRTALFIDGQWRESSGTHAIAVVNPATEEPIGSVVVGSVDDAHAAIHAARRSFDDGPWAQMHPRERTTHLLRLADLLEARSDVLTSAIVAENGYTQSRARQVHVDAVLEHLRFFAEASSRFENTGIRPSVRNKGAGQTVLVAGSKILEPIGVCTAIVPFNAPFLASIAKAGAALAMGNSVVLKPSPHSPLQTFLLAEALEEADLPPGIFNLVTGDADVGELLTSDDRIDLVSFTGSEVVGSLIMQQAARTLKRVVLELGGKSALIVREDADLERAVAIGTDSMISQSGQGCSLTTRHLVHQSLLADYLAGVSERVGGVVIGDPVDPNVTMGPLIREHQRTRVEKYVQSALDGGAKLVFGGQRPPSLTRGYFYEPTMFVDVAPDSTIAQEEVFGPVSAVLPFADDAEAAAIANQSRYGLGGMVVSRDSGAAYNLAREIRTGQVHINGGSGVLYAEAPFGGYKRSGLGREYGEDGLLEYTQTKVVTFNAG